MEHFAATHYLIISDGAVSQTCRDINQYWSWRIIWAEEDVAIDPKGIRPSQPDVAWKSVSLTCSVTTGNIIIARSFRGMSVHEWFGPIFFAFNRVEWDRTTRLFVCSRACSGTLVFISYKPFCPLSTINTIFNFSFQSVFIFNSLWSGRVNLHSFFLNFNSF